MLRLFLLMWLGFLVSGCSTMKHKSMPISDSMSLQQGKRLFEDGYYRSALHYLLPLACKGDAEAQYAVGYMYYYGYGVTQDTDVGFFWIQMSAANGCDKADIALRFISTDKDSAFHLKNKLKQE